MVSGSECLLAGFVPAGLQISRRWRTAEMQFFMKAGGFAGTNQARVAQRRAPPS